MKKRECHDSLCVGIARVEPDCCPRLFNTKTVRLFGLLFTVGGMLHYTGLSKRCKGSGKGSVQGDRETKELLRQYVVARGAFAQMPEAALVCLPRAEVLGCFPQ